MAAVVPTKPKSFPLLPWSTCCVMGCAINESSEIILLKCFHSICSDSCLEKLKSPHGQNVTCKSCKSRSNMKSLKKLVLENFFPKKKILEVPKEPLRCDSCIAMLLATAYCKDCDFFLCGRCADFHKQVKTTINHVLEYDDLEQYRRDDSQAEEVEQQCQLEDHAQNPLLYYCQTCDAKFCKICAPDHIGHATFVLARERLALTEKIDAVTSFVSKCNKLIDGLVESHHILSTEDWKLATTYMSRQYALLFRDWESEYKQSEFELRRVFDTMFYKIGRKISTVKKAQQIAQEFLVVAKEISAKCDSVAVVNLLRFCGKDGNEDSWLWNVERKSQEMDGLLGTAECKFLSSDELARFKAEVVKITDRSDELRKAAIFIDNDAQKLNSKLTIEAVSRAAPKEPPKQRKRHKSVKDPESPETYSSKSETSIDINIAGTEYYYCESTGQFLPEKITKRCEKLDQVIKINGYKTKIKKVDKLKSKVQRSPKHSHDKHMELMDVENITEDIENTESTTHVDININDSENINGISSFEAEEGQGRNLPERCNPYSIDESQDVIEISDVDINQNGIKDSFEPEIQVERDKVKGQTGTESVNFNNSAKKRSLVTPTPESDEMTSKGLKRIRRKSEQNYFFHIVKDAVDFESVPISSLEDAPSDCDYPIQLPEKMKISGDLNDGEGEDYCCICRDGRDFNDDNDIMICCDFCPKVFHLRCHIPVVKQFPEDEEPWRCNYEMPKESLDELIAQCNGNNENIENQLLELVESNKTHFQLACSFMMECHKIQEIPTVRWRFPQKYLQKFGTVPLHLKYIRERLCLGQPKPFSNAEEMLKSFRQMFIQAFMIYTKNQKFRPEAFKCFTRFLKIVEDYYPQYKTIFSGILDD